MFISQMVGPVAQVYQQQLQSEVAHERRMFHARAASQSVATPGTPSLQVTLASAFAIAAFELLAAWSRPWRSGCHLFPMGWPFRSSRTDNGPFAPNRHLVETHVSHVLNTLSAVNRREAAAIAARRGLI